MIDDLNRRFGNLHDAVSGAAHALTGPVFERFCLALASVAADHPPLAVKFSDLKRRARELADRLAEPDDLPW